MNRSYYSYSYFLDYFFGLGYYFGGGGGGGVCLLVELLLLLVYVLEEEDCWDCLLLKILLKIEKEYLGVWYRETIFRGMANIINYCRKYLFE